MSPAGSEAHERILVLRSPANLKISSPCVGLCKLDDQGVCVGCFRKIEEIAAWMRLTEFQKRQIVAALAERRLAATRQGGKGLNE